LPCKWSKTNIKLIIINTKYIIEITVISTLLYACEASLFALSNFRISFIRRHASNVAHLLARVVLSFASRQEFEYIPSCIEVTLMNEMR
jgi:hypothetical protein